ncbi:MAG: DUF4366 domain-containing protein [Acetatifactor sp.]|nr:DUF4366 domain-containing protein [Lachnospiraceae bacterium]MDE5951784.1 DUF4366 domain-containing protein [Acetatifactor sp.]
MNLTDLKKLTELLGSKKEEEKKGNVLVWILAIIGVIAAVAAIAYAVYRYFTPTYLEDFEDDFEDEFEDEDDDEEDIFEDEGDN